MVQLIDMMEMFIIQTLLTEYSHIFSSRPSAVVVSIIYSIHSSFETHISTSSSPKLKREKEEKMSEIG
jgi:hypothetical protein